MWTQEWLDQIKFQRSIWSYVQMRSVALFVTSLTNQLNVKSFLRSGSSSKSAPSRKSATPSNQATIDLSPILSKVYEKVIMTQLVHHLEMNQLLLKHQSGFRKGHCTISTCLKVKDDITKAMDRSKVTLVVMANFSKAFDTVDFRTLIEKSMKILASYLTYRIGSSISK